MSYTKTMTTTSADNNNPVKYRMGDRISESALIKRMYALANSAETARKADTAVTAAQSAVDATAAALATARAALDQLTAAGITDGAAHDALAANLAACERNHSDANSVLSNAVAAAESAHAVALPPMSDETRDYLAAYMTALFDTDGTTWGMRTNNQRARVCAALADLFGATFDAPPAV